MLCQIHLNSSLTEILSSMGVVLLPGSQSPPEVTEKPGCCCSVGPAERRGRVGGIRT